MNQSKFLLLLTIPLILVLVSPLSAQQVTKIAIVNSGRAFEQSDEGKKIASQLSERDTKIKNDLQKLDDSIRSLETRLATAQLAMTQEALIGLQSDLEKKRTERKRYEEDSAQDFARFRATLVNKLQTEMLAIITAMRKEKGYDLILDIATSGIVDFDPAIDITDELVRRYTASKTGIPPVKK